MIYLIPTDTCYGMACPIHDLKAYSGIYKIKKRHLDKPLAIMVENFKWLEENTDLTKNQIDFLKKYEKPFTIITNSDHLSLWINYVDPENNEFINRDMYTKFAFRVATNDIQKKLLKQEGPIFLTSANLSKKPEMYSSNEVSKEFEYYLEKGKITFLGKNNGNLPENGVSKIFEFLGDSLEIKYLRK